MATGKELQNLTEKTVPVTTDIFYIVSDPSGTPVSRKVTIANLFASGQKIVPIAGSFTHIEAPSISGKMFRMSAVNGADDPYMDWYPAYVTTTDGTATAIATIAIPASTMLMIESYIVARRTGGGAGTAEDGAGYIVRSTYKNVAGTPTLIGSVTGVYTAEDQAAFGTNHVISGSNVEVRVTGAASNNVSWSGFIRVMGIGA